MAGKNPMHHRCLGRIFLVFPFTHPFHLSETS